MKHRISGKKLGRNTNQRKALWLNQVRSMFIYGKIKTTSAKSKSVLPVIEKLGTVIMTQPDLIARRALFRYLQDRTWVNNVYDQFRKVFDGRTANFTKITRIKRRWGDDALIVELSFIKPIAFSQSKMTKKVAMTAPTSANSQVKPIANRSVKKKNETKKEVKDETKNKRSQRK
ncbi:MAG TPA: L17 family ribosomal protein [Candidatus Woesebacteria bacterium]|nr:L17 family ribosomal protein [Candidatus Woesebacteria bacterium]HRT39780.1 L17 family ribosomal protein [Candidatus Woesebacteria bacterium]